MHNIIKLFDKAVRSWRKIDFDHDCWINGEQRIFRNGLTAKQALRLSNQVEGPEREDWLKEYFWLREAEFEAALAEKCARKTLDYLKNGEIKKAKIFAEKVIKIEGQFKSKGNRCWEEFCQEINNLEGAGNIILSKRSSFFGEDGHEELISCNFGFFCRSFPIAEFDDLQPYAAEVLVETLRQVTKYKIDWYYENEAVNIITTGNPLVVSESLEKLSHLVSYLQSISVVFKRFDALDLGSFKIIEKCKTAFPEADFSKLVEYFESVEILPEELGVM